MKKTGFDAYDNAIDICAAMAGVLAKIRAHDADLADEAKRATSSISLNVAEGRKRTGKDRTHAFKIALGSADEVRAALDQAEVWHYASESELEEPRRLLDKEIAMLWVLGRGR